MEETRIYSKLVSGIKDGYVTDYTCIEDAHLTSLLYDQLKALRDTSKLVPGHYYRITDYVTTCCASGLANNTVYYAKGFNYQPFDIIVKASDINTLDNEAMLAPKVPNTYYDFSKFKVKYDLDNDPSKYEFADVATDAFFYYSRSRYSATGRPFAYNNTVYYEYSNGTTSYYLPTTDPITSTDKKLYRLNGSVMSATTSKFSYGASRSAGGKGVIYYMEDSFGNEAPYDFLNIFFVKYSDQYQKATFPSETGCRNNKIGEYYKDGRLCLNNILLSKECSFNVFEQGCYSIELGAYAISNRFGINCNNIAVLYDGFPVPYFQYNKFGDNCSSLELTLTERPESTRAARYLDVATGMQGRLTLDDLMLGSLYTTLILKGTDGVLKYSSLLDLISTAGTNQIKVGYSELLRLRDSGALAPGVQYRITDYATTLNPDYRADLSVANHRFDIIVTADSVSTLMETASVMQADGDTYFTGIPLQSWEIKYCLDNDTRRFPWADPQGTGVIYYMKDHNDNVCCYDFKNLLIGKHYTFNIYDGNSYIDISSTPSCRNNTVKSFGGAVFSSNKGGVWGYNTIEENCSGITFGDMCSFNHVGADSCKIAFGNTCQHNSIYIGCTAIILSDNCFSNTFGLGCSNISVGTQSRYNKFGDTCNNIRFSNNGWYNTFGEGCHNIYADNHFQHNTFGAECCNIMFSKYRTSVNNSTNYRGYCQYNKFANGSANLIIYKECEVCLSNRINNLNILSGMSGTEYTFLEIDNLNINYEIFIGKNSNGEVKMFSLTDLIL